ncbi:hypothetical protein ASA1KI_07760 [Opitutales bacterium ASA1]|nr:hypothetical protein ASA1KI_07760 [Opitutales bacterium ASA1]
MSYLIIVGLALVLIWLGRRHAIVMRGVRELEYSIRSRRALLLEDTRLSGLHGSWSRLVDGVSGLLAELGRLGHQQADQLMQLETTLGNLQEAVLIVDRDNYILLANKALRNMFPGFEGLPGTRLEAVLRSAEFLGFLEALRVGRAEQQRVIEFRPGNRSVWLETTGAVVPETAARNGPWHLFVLHDVTRQRHLERVRREFVANVSHELKTPLSVIKGYSETLVDDHRALPPEQIEQFAAAIHRHAERLAAIVEDLLTLSRLEDGQEAAESKRESMSMRRLLAVVADEIGQDVPSEGDRALVVDLPPEDGIVAVDLLRMHQVFGNLIENARKYTPRGTRIEVGGRIAGDSAEFWVRDYGQGIPPSDLPRIFERFYRVEKGRSREKGGTGLGLSIVKHIVQMHGGSIRAESELGKGLRVVFTLPLLRSGP